MASGPSVGACSGPPEPGATVLDVPGGAGASMPLLRSRVGPTGRVVGVDDSPGTLARARSRVTEAGWNDVVLVGLTVVPDWREVFQRVFEVIRPGGRIAVMDLNLDRERTSGIANTYHRLLVQADSHRRVLETLVEQADDVQVTDHDWFGGVARFAAGT